jgi:IS30 family transposase
MGNRYSQLDLDERMELSCLRDAGYSLRKIGRLMNRSHTTVGRELKRNSLPGISGSCHSYLGFFPYSSPASDNRWPGHRAGATN